MGILYPNQIKAKRREYHLTQTELAKKAGVSQSLITKIERGQLDPTFSVLLQISNALSDEKITAKSIMKKHVVWSVGNKKDDLALMKKKGISQLVVSQNRVVSEKSMLKGFEYEEVASIPQDMPIETIKQILLVSSCVLVVDESEVIGIVTRTDVL